MPRGFPVGRVGFAIQVAEVFPRSRSLNFCTLLVGVMGSASSTSTYRGTKKYGAFASMNCAELEGIDVLTLLRDEAYFELLFGREILDRHPHRRDLGHCRMLSRNVFHLERRRIAPLVP